MLVSSISAILAILLLAGVEQYISSGISFWLLILASMGATAFLLFVTPHSPMAQLWPVVGGHLVSAAIGVASAQWIDSAATAMIAVLCGPEVHAIGWHFCYEVVTINTGMIILLALVINNLITGRRYPLLHSHNPHPAQLAQVGCKEPLELKEEALNGHLVKWMGTSTIICPR
jgi:CBS domain-containing membrane protein